MYGISSVNVLCCAVLCCIPQFNNKACKFAQSEKKGREWGVAVYRVQRTCESMDNERIKSQDDVFADIF
jgi:hypothetical protein